jgi:parallel beta-helix repeat protein
VKDTNNTATGWYVPGVSQQAYFATGSSRCTFTGNTAYGSGREAIWLNNSNYKSIRGTRLMIVALILAGILTSFKYVHL